MGRPAPAGDSGTAALVTGASSGIGAAIARELAARGHGVALLARRQERLESLAEEISSAHGVLAVPLPCDLADPAARAEVPGRLEALGLEVEILVNDAGLGSFGDLVDSDRGAQLEQVRVMSEAVVDLTHAFAPAMAARGRGGIAIVSSAIGLTPTPGYATYGATRAFCIAFGEALHAELGRRGVAVTTVCPGLVDSEFFAANGPQPVERLMPRFLRQSPEQVARATLAGLEGNRRLVVPGRRMRALVGAGKLVPRGLWLAAGDRLLRAAPTGPHKSSSDMPGAAKLHREGRRGEGKRL